MKKNKIFKIIITIVVAALQLFLFATFFHPSLSHQYKDDHSLDFKKYKIIKIKASLLTQRQKNRPMSLYTNQAKLVVTKVYFFSQADSIDDYVKEGHEDFNYYYIRVHYSEITKVLDHKEPFILMDLQAIKDRVSTHKVEELHYE